MRMRDTALRNAIAPQHDSIVVRVALVFCSKDCSSPGSGPSSGIREEDVRLDMNVDMNMHEASGASCGVEHRRERAFYSVPDLGFLRWAYFSVADRYLSPYLRFVSIILVWYQFDIVLFR
ncbi:hypothetical protein IQ07DRAFT_415413 [Pyrenochaeta sp. DS3sAY3a]|nr:hypothetical protein IQ07DRAFT_415413 [Pyrenochaeta sp. DS3sAY3a]